MIDVSRINKELSAVSDMVKLTAFPTGELLFCVEIPETMLRETAEKKFEIILSCSLSPISIYEISENIDDMRVVFISNGCDMSQAVIEQSTVIYKDRHGNVSKHHTDKFWGDDKDRFIGFTGSKGAMYSKMLSFFVGGRARNEITVLPYIINDCIVFLLLADDWCLDRLDSFISDEMTLIEQAKFIKSGDYTIIELIIQSKKMYDRLISGEVRPTINKRIDGLYVVLEESKVAMARIENNDTIFHIRREETLQLRHHYNILTYRW